MKINTPEPPAQGLFCLKPNDLTPPYPMKYSLLKQLLITLFITFS